MHFFHLKSTKYSLSIRHAFHRAIRRAFLRALRRIFTEIVDNAVRCVACFRGLGCFTGFVFKGCVVRLYTHIYTYIHIYIQKCIHTYKQTYIHTYTHTHTYIHTYRYACMHAYTHARGHHACDTYLAQKCVTCMVATWPPCMWDIFGPKMCHPEVHVLLVRMCGYLYVCIIACMYVCRYVNVCMHTCLHTCMHVYIRTYIHTCMDAMSIV